MPVTNSALAITVRHLRYSHDLLCARSDCFGHRLVGAFHVKIIRPRHGWEGMRRFTDHDGRSAHPHLCVRNPIAVHVPQDLFPAQALNQELKEVSGTLDKEVRRDRIEAWGDEQGVLLVRPDEYQPTGDPLRGRGSAYGTSTLSDGLGGMGCPCYRPRRYSSMNCHVWAPSKRRTRTEAISSGAKLPRFTPCLAPGSGVIGSQ